MQTGLRARLLDVARAVRFGIVGISATLTYLVLANLLAVPLGPMTAFHAHVAAICCSILVSYTGHHAFTFARKGRHGFYFGRFAAITALLFVLTSALAYAMDADLHLPALVISIAVTVLYMAASFVLHSLWTFVAEREPA